MDQALAVSLLVGAIVFYLVEQGHHILGYSNSPGASSRQTETIATYGVLICLAMITIQNSSYSLDLSRGSNDQTLLALAATVGLYTFFRYYESDGTGARETNFPEADSRALRSTHLIRDLTDGQQGSGARNAVTGCPMPSFCGRPGRAEPMATGPPNFDEDLMTLKQDNKARVVPCLNATVLAVAGDPPAPKAPPKGAKGKKALDKEAEADIHRARRKSSVLQNPVGKQQRKPTSDTYVPKNAPVAAAPFPKKQPQSDTDTDTLKTHVEDGKVGPDKEGGGKSKEKISRAKLKEDGPTSKQKEIPRGQDDVTATDTSETGDIVRQPKDPNAKEPGKELEPSASTKKKNPAIHNANLEDDEDITGEQISPLEEKMGDENSRPRKDPEDSHTLDVREVNSKRRTTYLIKDQEPTDSGTWAKGQIKTTAKTMSDNIGTDAPPQEQANLPQRPIRKQSKRSPPQSPPEQTEVSPQMPENTTSLQKPRRESAPPQELKSPPPPQKLRTSSHSVEQEVPISKESKGGKLRSQKGRDRVQRKALKPPPPNRQQTTQQHLTQDEEQRRGVVKSVPFDLVSEEEADIHRLRSQSEMLESQVSPSVDSDVNRGAGNQEVYQYHSSNASEGEGYRTHVTVNKKITVNKNIQQRQEPEVEFEKGDLRDPQLSHVSVVPGATVEPLPNKKNNFGETELQQETSSFLPIPPPEPPREEEPEEEKPVRRKIVIPPPSPPVELESRESSVQELRQVNQNTSTVPCGYCQHETMIIVKQSDANSPPITVFVPLVDAYGRKSGKSFQLGGSNSILNLSKFNLDDSLATVHSRSQDLAEAERQSRCQCLKRLEKAKRDHAALKGTIPDPKGLRIRPYKSKWLQKCGGMPQSRFSSLSSPVSIYKVFLLAVLVFTLYNIVTGMSSSSGSRLIELQEPRSVLSTLLIGCIMVILYVQWSQWSSNSKRDIYRLYD